MYRLDCWLFIVRLASLLPSMVQDKTVFQPESIFMEKVEAEADSENAVLNGDIQLAIIGEANKPTVNYPIE
ncbi:hypothetical protein SVI_1189 [Shewanella violacea DSS12]|uniref:Uncharacterized protein n=1 Tax=Shewanella violacea (strain JCM 10179 / CIP 106290 / LMG 19151 / DSS12) TaxID=637905 RepID=D4ZHL1_SHEVD|nr:hypothetical protein SVI_1189 [Shewanella violacea DSS12]